MKEEVSRQYLLSLPVKERVAKLEEWKKKMGVKNLIKEFGFKYASQYYSFLKTHDLYKSLVKDSKDAGEEVRYIILDKAPKFPVSTEERFNNDFSYVLCTTTGSKELSEKLIALGEFIGKEDGRSYDVELVVRSSRT